MAEQQHNRVEQVRHLPQRRGAARAARPAVLQGRLHVPATVACRPRRVRHDHVQPHVRAGAHRGRCLRSAPGPPAPQAATATTAAPQGREVLRPRPDEKLILQFEQPKSNTMDRQEVDNMLKCYGQEVLALDMVDD